MSGSAMLTPCKAEFWQKEPLQENDDAHLREILRIQKMDHPKAIKLPISINKDKFAIICVLSKELLLRAKPELFEQHLKDNSIRVPLCLFSQIDTCDLLHFKWKLLRQS